MLSADRAEAWFRVPTASYDFLSAAEREALLGRVAGGIASLRDAECHLLVVPRAYSPQAWRASLDAATARPSPGWHRYSGALESHVAGLAFWTREAYLGVVLGPRRGSGVDGLRRRVEHAAGLIEGEPSDAELNRWHNAAEGVGRVLQAGGLRARPATGGELCWLVRRCFWRGGLGDDAPLPACRAARGAVEALAEGTIRNGHRSLVLEQPAGEAHVAFLATARFPDLLPFPGGEWLYHCDSLGFPVEASVRFRVVPPRTASADAAKKLAEAADQARHISGTSAELPLALVETAERARQLEYALTKEGTPLVYGWPRFAVAGASADELAAQVDYLVESYRDVGIELVRPSGDQLSLFLEAIPGDRLRVHAYEQRQAVSTLAGSMFVATTELGDGAGPYLGETTGRTRAAVHFDPLAAAQRNLPTSIAITGQPGTGKTNLAELLLFQMAMRGTWCLLIDPKNEASGLGELPGLGDVRVLELGPRHAGLLDPFSVAETAREGALLAVDVLRLLLPSGLSADQEAALLSACRAETERERPSLQGVVERLRESPEPVAERLSSTLGYFADLPLAQLCFSPGAGDRLDPEERLTILQIQGLSFPEADTPRSEYTLADRLAVAVMFLVTAFAHRLADAARVQAKAIVLDEAWALTGSRQGRSLVQRLARTGRSKNTAFVLVTQNAGDLLEETVTNNLSACFAFRSTQADEVGAVLRLLGVDPTPAHAAMVCSLGNGECVFRDVDGRVGTLQVDLVLPELAAAFDTTPRPRPLEAVV
ncbi:MAG: ATP-binding protein [Actinomycetes bacterium]